MRKLSILLIKIMRSFIGHYKCIIVHYEYLYFNALYIQASREELPERFLFQFRFSFFLDFLLVLSRESKILAAADTNTSENLVSQLLQQYSKFYLIFNTVLSN